VAQLYTLANAINDMPLDAAGAGAARRFAIETLTVLLAPIAPHVAEEMWFNLGHDNMLARSAWPVADPAMLAEDTIEIGVQVNGKLRDTVSLARDVDEDVARAAALETAGVIRYLEGASPKKIIVVKNRIINVVI
jgi:leucyl-tRNA synthetase